MMFDLSIIQIYEEYDSFINVELSDEEYIKRIEIINRENELNKLDKKGCDIDESLKFKSIVFEDWFPSELKQKLSDLAARNFLGRSFRLVHLDIIIKYFTDNDLKSYWKSVNKNSKNFGDIEFAWLINIPLYSYFLATYKINKVEKLSHPEFVRKSKLAARKANDLVKLIDELDCDLNLMYLYLQTDFKKKNLDISMLNIFSENYSGRVHLSDVLNIFSVVVKALPDAYKDIIDKPNIKNQNEIYFVKLLCHHFSISYKTPHHSHSKNLANVFFETNFSKDNIRSKTKKLRNSDINIDFINNELKVKGELMHKILDEGDIGLYNQFYFNSKLYTQFASKDNSMSYYCSRISSEYFDREYRGIEYMYPE